MTDQVLELKIIDLQKSIKAWAEERELWTDCGFKSYKEQFEDEPNEYASCVTVLYTEGALFSMLNGYAYSDYLEEFEVFMATTGFYYEAYNHYIFSFYAEDEVLNNAYIEYFEWQWVTELIKPDYTSLYEEVFEYFNKNPNDLYALHHRKYEILISEIFKNQGYRTELGSGTNDGGIDIKLFKKDDIDEIITLVQVKKYKPDLPIALEAVSSLSAIVNQENANRGLFVTTSRFLPVAQRFALREKTRLTLATSTEVSQWCENAGKIISRDKSNLFSDKFLLKLLDTDHPNDLVGKLLVASVGYGMVSNDFCVVVKDTPHIALIMRVPRSIQFEDQPYNTKGYEIPVLNEQILAFRTKDNVFRAKKSKDPAGRITFAANKTLYVLWDGTKQYFDHID